MIIKCPCCDKEINIYIAATSQDTNSLTIELDDIVKSVTARTGISIDQMRSPRRKRELVLARHRCMWLANQFTELSMSKIGKYFHRNHATVIHAARAINNLLDTDEKERVEMSVLKAMIGLQERRIA